MRLPRRELLQWGALSAAGLAAAGCRSFEQQLTHPDLDPDALHAVPPNHSPAVRILYRAGFGPRPGEAAVVEKMGIPAYVDEQLYPEKIEESAPATWRVRALGDSLNSDTGLLFDQDDHRLINTLRQAAILRAVYSRRQLLERMVEFWGDHFNIYAFKGQGPQLKVVDDGATIRQHALGRFRDLLGASAHSAAMLGYLDNTSNRKGVPNENYARELMELHTLGVDGGYTQADVKEVARCLTGWNSERHWHRGKFHFDPDLHDDGPKRVLGHTLPAGGGVEDGERVLDILAIHPSTARHLARKLSIYFLGWQDPVWVERLAAVYLRTGGDIRETLRPLLTSPELLSSAPILKRPFDYMVSALRTLNVDTDGDLPLQKHLEKMGQPLFAWPMPDGFPQGAGAWTGTLIARWNFAMALAGNTINNTQVDWDELSGAAKGAGLSAHDGLLELVFSAPAAEPTLERLRRLAADHSDPPEFSAVLLMSPEFQWR
ncbi:MAG: DUF1800 domain-containing protein [Armatimonadota bacterium]|nr:DUF1800 domain-containing protein [Armatimonadota bacterium]